MKWIFGALIIASTNLAIASECVKFSENEYCKVWEKSDGDIKTIEFLRKDQSLESWNKMITVKHYSDKSALKQVLPSYVKSVKSMFALKPEVLAPDESVHDEEIYLRLLLLAPDKSHYEYVVNRFYRNDSEVKSIFYSHKIPFSEKVDFTEVMESKNSWLEQLKTKQMDSFVGE